MLDFLQNLFNTSGFPPRWHCGLWTSGHGWLHILSDIGIGLAYYTIPFILVYVAARRKDIPFRSLFWLFGAFILACGSTHLMDAVIFWWPAYRFSGLLKLVTAIASWATVLALVPVIPKALQLRSPEQLEEEVKRRTAELAEANRLLQQEIAERKQTEARLREQRERLRVTLKSIGDAVIVTDAEGCVTAANPVAEELTGWTEAEALGKPLESIFPIANELTGEVVSNPVRKVLQEGKIVGLANHTILISKDGRRRPIDDSGAPIRDDAGRTLGVVLVFRDVTERRLAEQTAQRLVAMVESSADAIIGQGADGTIESWNRGAQEMLGYSADEAVGRPISMLYSDEDASETASMEEALKRGERIDQHETDWVRKDGKRLAVAATFTPVKNRVGRISQVSVIARDITEQLKADRLRMARLGIGDTFSGLTPVNDVVPRLLQVICENLEWEYGALWTVDEQAELMRCQTTWCKLGAGIEEFEQDARQRHLARGESLPGRVWLTGQPVWLLDAATTPYLFRAPIALRVGLRSAFAIPITQAGRAYGVLEFFSREPRESDADLLELATTLGDQIGSLMERKRAEEEIHKLNDQLHHRVNELQTLIEVVPIGIGVAEDAQCSRVWGNRALTEMFGLAAEAPVSFGRDAADEPAHEFHRHGKQLCEEELPLHLAITQGIEVRGEEMTLRRQDGVERELLGYGAPLLDESRSVRGAVAAFLDITDRKRAERGLRFLADAGTQLVQFGDYPSMLQKVARLGLPFFADWCLLGLTAEAGEAKRVASAHSRPEKEELVQRLHSEQRNPWSPEGLIASVLQSGQPKLVAEVSDSLLDSMVSNEEEQTLIRQVNPQSLIIVPLCFRERVLGVMQLAITESSRRYTPDDLLLAEELARRTAVAVENARLYEGLREADRRKDEFLAMLAHELRNPLAPIRSGLELLAMEGVTSDTVQLMQEQVNHLVRLVDDLLDVSRILRRKVELRREPVEVAKVVEQAVVTARPFIDAQNHALDVFLPTDPIWLDADPVRLVQVLGNLLTNAAKYTQRGGKIGLTVERQADQVAIRVTDNGVGIAPELLPRVFDLFTQGDQSIDRSQGGLGIGLTLVWNLVEMHGGTVEARSAGLGKGAEFIVRLPVSAQRQKEPVRQQRMVPTTPRRILIVEDNVGAAKVLARLLAKTGAHEIQVAHDGETGVELAKQFHPELVLLDIGLPIMNGYEVAKRLREEPSGEAMLIVALTGYGQEEDRRRSKEAGFDEHLLKPPALDILRTLFSHPKLSQHVIV